MDIVSNKNKADGKQDCNQIWRWINLRPMRAGSVLDDGKSPLYKYWQCLEVLLLSVVVVVVLLLMLLPTINVNVEPSTRILFCQRCYHTRMME